VANVRVVAIAGWTCTGKTRFARALAARLPGWKPVVLSQDDYYRDTSHLSRRARTAVNYDEPESYDLDRFAEHLEALRSGRSVPRFRYDFSTGARRASGSLGPAGLVVAEGVFALWDARIREAADLRILLEGDLDELLRRRIARDTDERAYTATEIRERFASMVIPAQRRYLAGAARFAQLVFPADWDEDAVSRAAACLGVDTSVLPPAVQAKGTTS
jgi:uridine kinase